jgi:hypothetical protein
MITAFRSVLSMECRQDVKMVNVKVVSNITKIINIYIKKNLILHPLIMT